MFARQKVSNTLKNLLLSVMPSRVASRYLELIHFRVNGLEMEWARCR